MCHQKITVTASINDLSLIGLTICVLGSVLCFLGCSANGNNSFPEACIPTQAAPCTCADNSPGWKTCSGDGLGFSDCDCHNPIDKQAVRGEESTLSAPVASTNTTPSSGPISSSPPPQNSQIAGASGGNTPSIDTAFNTPIDAGTDGAIAQNPTPSPTAGSGSNTGTADPTVSGDDLDAVRQVCVDYINQYRATLGLAPLRRATPEQEMCSDRGAEQDGVAQIPHSSAGSCPGMGAQNTCPGWQVGGWSGNATLADALKGCLDSMWAEGEPPVPISECMRDYQGCFMLYGHYINMSSPTSTVVSCGLYEVSPGEWWMNQDFGM